MSWIKVCELNDILPFGGRCALVNDDQVAIFRVNVNNEDQLFAISNYDPFSQANVLSRGLVGSLKEQIVVASPVYKQHFDLRTGQCIEDESVQLPVWEIKLDGDQVLVNTGS